MLIWYFPQGYAHLRLQPIGQSSPGGWDIFVLWSPPAWTVRDIVPANCMRQRERKCHAQIPRTVWCCGHVFYRRSVELTQDWIQKDGNIAEVDTQYAGVTRRKPCEWVERKLALDRAMLIAAGMGQIRGM